MIIIIIINPQIDLRKTSLYIIILKTKLFLSLISKISKIPKVYNSLDFKVVTIDLALKYVILNRIIIYRKPEITKSLAQLLDNYQDLFIN